MRRELQLLGWMMPREATLDVLVDAELLREAVAYLGAPRAERRSDGTPRQVFLIASDDQLAVSDALGEEYPTGMEFPATVIRSGQTGVELPQLALMVKMLLPGMVRLFVEGRLLNVIGMVGQPFNFRACLRVQKDPAAITEEHPPSQS